MNLETYRAALEHHYDGLISVSDLQPTELLQAAFCLAHLEPSVQVQSSAVQAAFLSCSLSHWRLAVGEAVWEGLECSADFLARQGDESRVVDAWYEESPQAQPLLIEILVQQARLATELKQGLGNGG